MALLGICLAGVLPFVLLRALFWPVHKTKNVARKAKIKRLCNAQNSGKLGNALGPIFMHAAWRAYCTTGKLPCYLGGGSHLGGDLPVDKTKKKYKTTLP